MEELSIILKNLNLKKEVKKLFMKTRCRGAIFFIILFTGYNVTAQKIFTLKQCVDTAIANNLLVKQSDLQMQNAVVYMNGSALPIVLT